MTECLKCGQTDYKFCPKCGDEMTELPICNWCNTDLWRFMAHCPDCGRSRYEALSTSPPPPPPPPPAPKKIAQFLARLFSGNSTQETAE